jgi:ketosteroid isomerase-like protein
MWSYFHLERSRVKLDKLIVEGEEAVALGIFSHVANATEQPFTTPFALHVTVKDGAITALQLYEDTYVVGKAFGV